MFKPRPSQLDILNYAGGKMGVSAVPGSGKTHTLSYLAAKIIASGKIADDQEILIVTLVNSAVNNFSQRVAGFMQSFGLLPNIGYRVRTLHGLAHDIVRERPDLVGLDTQFQIIDERESSQIINGSVSSWLRRNPDFFQIWTRPEHIDRTDSYFSNAWQRSIASIARNFIRLAKDLEASPQDVADKIQQMKIENPLLEMGSEIYQEYQKALSYRSSVDFDDLIRFALKSLKMDPEYLERLQHRWPYILEDEAQDSSRLQELILRMLSGKTGNWIRVGDPNQAIYESFTTASPEFLKSFLRDPEVVDRDLPNSGRSTQSIIQLANELIRWTMENHPVEEVRQALTTPFIKPTTGTDPQPNPADQPEGITLFMKKLSAEEEINLITKSVKKWLSNHPEETCAILIPRNERGARVVEKLQQLEVPYVEILQTSQPTRETANILASILKFLSNPSQTTNIIKLFEVMNRHRKWLTKELTLEAIPLLRSCSHYEEYLYPLPEKDWLSKTITLQEGLNQEIVSALKEFRDIVIRWQEAENMPINQLLITLGQDLFENQTDLALTHKLALLLEQAANAHPEWHLPDFADELALIAENRRKILGFTEEDNGFDPDAHKGKVVVTTYHKSKGLEWDRVYLMSVNNYDFPSASSGDEFMSEKWFYREAINLEAETLFRLKALFNEDNALLNIEDGYATQLARYEYASERLRLFFVGITRAKKELTITWNSGDTHRSRRASLFPALAFTALRSFWEGLENESA